MEHGLHGLHGCAKRRSAKHKNPCLSDTSVFKDYNSVQVNLASYEKTIPSNSFGVPFFIVPKD